ncbi:hypothetical protein ACLSU7_18825 [Bdellovibrio sp. HCB185ZH]|uniref:hypothetical protein n=1 Tax=Bdellovibrio sp. HCB185ZH TaxID=3394235 RepID=UPI0039A68664
MAAGFSKEINPLSGMSVNLVLVDQWLSELKKDLEQTVFTSESDSLSHAFAEILAVTRLNLTGHAVDEDAELISLDFREERGWGFSWNHLQSPVEMMVKHSHYLEGFLAAPEDASLCKVEFVWLRTQDCETDFAHEGFKILKNLVAKNFEELQAKLALHKGGELDSGSFLAEINLHNLSKEYKITL